MPSVRIVGAALAAWLSACAPHAAPPAGSSGAEPWPGHWPAQRCEHAPCPAGFICRYFRGDAGVEGRCLLAPGYCWSAVDCAPTQRCRRFGAELGVCSERGF